MRICRGNRLAYTHFLARKQLTAWFLAKPTDSVLGYFLPQVRHSLQRTDDVKILGNLDYYAEPRGPGA
jgi:hypothetical protein